MSIWDIIRIPFGYLLEWLYLLTSNYGVALILFSLVIKLVLLPMSMKSKKSTMKMARVSPMLKDLERKYGDDKEKYQQAVMKFYKDEGVSPTGGCLWSLIPLLILIPLYQVVRQPLVYLMHLSPEAAQTAVDKLLELGAELGKNTYFHQLSAASALPQYLDQLKAAVPELASYTGRFLNFSFLGIDLSQVPNVRFWTLAGWGAIGLFLIPVISGFSNWLSMWLSQKFNNSVATDDKGQKEENVPDTAAATTKSMMITMPLVSIYIGFTMPAAMSIYWIAQAFLGIVQEYVLTKHYRKIYDAEDAIKKQRAAEQAAIEAEKERIRAERRAQNPDGIQAANTSKKKLKAKEKAERAMTVEGKLTPEEREALRAKRAAAGQDPDRPHCRGRAYIADRYAADGTENYTEETAEVVDDYEEPEDPVEVVDDYEEPDAPETEEAVEDAGDSEEE